MLKLLGIPYDGNSSFLQGPRKAPFIIKKMDVSGSANRFTERGKEIVPEFNYVHLEEMNFDGCNSEEAYLKIKKRVSQEIKGSDKLLSIGGDHSIAFPTIEAHAQKYGKIDVLQLDAHGDLYENFDNNPYSHASPFARLLEKGCLNSLTQVGIRSLNSHQRDQIEKYKVKVVEMKDFEMDFIQQLPSSIYISLDMDVLDPAFAPGVSHHEPGGMDSRTLIDIIQHINSKILGAEIVEYNPDRDFNNMTAMIQYKLFKEIAEKMI